MVETQPSRALLRPSDLLEGRRARPLAPRRGPPPKPYVYCTPQEYERMLAASLNVAALGQRETLRLFLRTLWETGGRIEEVLDLRHTDIHRDFLLLPTQKKAPRRTTEEKLRPPTNPRDHVRQVFLNPQSSLIRDLLLSCQDRGVRGLDRVFPWGKRRAEQLFRACAELSAVFKPAKRTGLSGWSPPGPTPSGIQMPTGWPGRGCLQRSSGTSWATRPWR